MSNPTPDRTAALDSAFNGTGQSEFYTNAIEQGKHRE